MTDSAEGSLTMPQVESSMIREVEHHGRKLEATFVSGRTYVYDGVSRKLYLALLKAKSKGSFLNDCIRGAFSYTDVTGQRSRVRSSLR